MRRTKFIATAALCLCVAVFATARMFQSRWPWLGFIAAFAEAATIGGIADWYAVVALFRRPLGLPIPHTAIVPANQNRIADNLGRFIEANFLAPEPVRKKLKEVDFAALVAEWLAHPSRAHDLSGFVGHLMPQAISAMEGSNLRGFIGQRVLDLLKKVRVAPLAAELLMAATEDRRHQKLFDELVGVLEKFLNDEAALAAMREKIRNELPSLFRVFQADAYLVRKIVASAGALFAEVLSDQNHALRHEFDRFVIGFIETLRDSPEYALRAEQLKQELLSRRELGSIADDIWKSLREFVEEDLKAEDSRMREHLASLFVDAGRQLAADPKVRADMNEGFVVALTAFVESQKSGVSTFIADQVKRWDLAQLTRLIELNIGRDLQYIRFNGMVIGGLAGLVLYSIEHLFFAN
ncbi:DUF445 family protein [Mesorhizobium sp. BAC0120]|nr:DUF445 family protein [Mesorhizobium sp. BAC0120]MDW6020375.1 DUF445 family protein [Mesorhizobium sp. BAC0120]